MGSWRDSAQESSIGTFYDVIVRLMHPSSLPSDLVRTIAKAPLHCEQPIQRGPQQIWMKNESPQHREEVWATGKVICTNSHAQLGVLPDFHLTAMRIQCVSKKIIQNLSQKRFVA